MKNSNLTIHEMEVVYLPKKYSGESLKVKDSKTAEIFLRQAFNPNSISYQEECIVMYLNNANEIIGIHQLSKGGITATIIDIRILLATALKCLATGIIVSHNHPSGNLVPSKLDKDLTEKLKAACKLLDINLLDHVIIVPDNAYFSFVDDGLLS